MISVVTEVLGKGSILEYSGGTNTCICPKCQFESLHKRGVPCNLVKCPKCGTLMTGKGAVGEEESVEDEPENNSN